MKNWIRRNKIPKTYKLISLVAIALLVSGYAENREEILRNAWHIDDLEKAAQAEPMSYDKQLALAKAYTEISDSSQIMPNAADMYAKYKKLAKNTYKKIDTLGPKDYKFYLEKSRIGVLLNHKVPADSYKAIDRAIELAPDNFDVKNRKVQMLSIDGRWEEMVPIEEQIIGLMIKNNPKDLWINEKRARLVDMLYCLNQEQKIVSVLQDIYSSNEDSERHYFSIMSFYYIYKTSHDPLTKAFFEKFKNDKSLSALHEKYGLDKPDREQLNQQSLDGRNGLCKRLMKWVER